jgi:hypothetical protein
MPTRTAYETIRWYVTRISAWRIPGAQAQFDNLEIRPWNRRRFEAVSNPLKHLRGDVVFEEEYSPLHCSNSQINREAPTPWSSSQLEQRASCVVHGGRRDIRDLADWTACRIENDLMMAEVKTACDDAEYDCSSPTRRPAQNASADGLQAPGPGQYGIGQTASRPALSGPCTGKA